jgi:hypothetical protein
MCEKNVPTGVILWVGGTLPLDAFGGTWPLDHRRELELAEELWAWLQENAAFLEAVFA